MADKIQTLLVSLEARINQYEKEMARANAIATRNANSVESRFRKMNANVSSSFTTLGSTVSRAFGVMGIALTTGAIISMTSAWTDLGSRVNNAAGDMDRGAAVMARLSEMARLTYSSLEQTAEGYLQNQQALSALGYSTQQQLDLVETLNNALVVGAVRGQRADSVMQAWSKAMASGSLRGENLNTVIQSGGRLSKALADSMGISVNELRKMGEQGKITTDVMYGVTSELERLREEAGNMPATVSDGLVLLKDAVMVFVGEADKAVGSSAALAEALIAISDAVRNAPEQVWFDKVFKGLGDELARTISDGARELEYIARILDALGKLGDSPADGLVALNEAFGGNVRTAEEFELALADAEQAVVNFVVNSKGRFGEVDAVVQDLFHQILNGRGSVESATEAVEELAKVNPDFAALKGGVLGIIETFYAMRDAAVAARTAASSVTSDLGDMPSWRQFGKTFGPDLSKDGAPGGPVRPPTSGGGGKSSGEKFGESVEQFKQRLENLRQETALMASLNPLLNDYGFAKEKLKATQELENAARKAGIELGPEQKAQIEALSVAYATATAEAAKLAEAQNATVRQFEELRDGARDALQTIIDGFIEGKDAGEIFADVLKNIGSQLLQMGMNSLFGGGATSGSGLFGKLFGYADGGYTGNGGKNEPAGVVHKGEYVFSKARTAQLGVANLERLHRGYASGGFVGAPGPVGGRVANDNGPSITYAPVIDARGADVAAVARLEQVLAKQSAEFEGRVKQVVRGKGTKWR